MDGNQLQIIEEVKKLVTEIFAKKVKPGFVFHNLEHTRQVAKAAEAIANFYQFSEPEKFILVVASWFHDTGFSTGRIEGHEIESIHIAQAFLQTHKADQATISRVAACIQSTKMPQKPESGIEKIICDADLFHLGTNYFNDRTELLRQELQFYYKTVLTEKEWRSQNLAFLKSHNYFTGYCQQMLEPVKQKWMAKLQRKAVA